MDRVLKYQNPKVNQLLSSEKGGLKVNKVYKKDQNEKTISLKGMPHHQHPYARFLRGNYPQLNEFKKFVTLFYKGLNYSLNNLKGPSQEFIKKKSITLPQNKDLTRQKFLMLDLDETLIHSIFNENEKADVNIQCQENQFKFNVRPYCNEFLDRMSQHFSIYIYTASTIDYATPIVDYLNKKKKTIQGILHRKNCMETNHGFFIKDLRVIKNRTLDKIVMVDNLVHSFGLQVQNGIPILDFTNNKNDMELIGLQKFLIQLSTADNVPDFLREKLRLRKMIDYKQDEIMKYFDQRNN